MSKITFIIYEKSYLIRKGLISIIEKIANTQVSMELDSEEEVSEAMNDLEADFFILNESIFENKNLIQEIKSTQSKISLIALSISYTKSNLSDQIVETIFLNDTQSTIVNKLGLLIGNIKSNISKKNTPDAISNREVDVLKHIALGFSNKEIADKLFLSTHTVVTHRKNITRKLGIKTVPGLTIYAILNKIIDINDTE